MLVDSFMRQRLLPAGYETAWLLLSLRALASEPVLVTLLKRLALLCVESSERVPMGTAWIRHTNWDSEKKRAPDAGGRRALPRVPWTPAGWCARSTSAFACSGSSRECNARPGAPNYRGPG